MRFIQTLVELANVGLAVVGPLALGIGVMNVKAESESLASGRPLQHLQITVRVPKCCDGAAANVLIDRYRLAGFIVKEV